MVARHAVEAIGVEVNLAFAAEARRPIDGARGQLDIREMSAVDFTDDRPFDCVFCIGASFAIGTVDEAMDWMVARTRPGGRIALGHLYARRLPMPPSPGDNFFDAQRSAGGAEPPRIHRSRARVAGLGAVRLPEKAALAPD